MSAPTEEQFMMLCGLLGDLHLQCKALRTQLAEHRASLHGVTRVLAGKVPKRREQRALMIAAHALLDKPLDAHPPPDARPPQCEPGGSNG